MVKKFANLKHYCHLSNLIHFVRNTIARATLRKLQPSPRDRILDIGREEGCVVGEIQNSYAVDLDIAETVVKNAMEFCNSTLGVLPDGENLQFRDHYFDKVICTHSLEHTLDPRRVVNETVGVLKENEVLLIAVPLEHMITAFRQVGSRLRIYDKLQTNSPLRMDDQWQLRTFVLKYLRTFLMGILRITTLSRILILAPLRYVARCNPTSPYETRNRKWATTGFRLLDHRSWIGSQDT
jgi:ubiquinone/menaquinone biosynthesis C-methylase UbiE